MFYFMISNANSQHIPSSVEYRKPAGGFCFISLEALYAAWFAYRHAIIRLEDLRVYFACIELPARRWGLTKGRAPRYRIEELEAWVGRVGERRIRASLSRLERNGLIRWSESSIVVAGNRDSIHAELREDFISKLEAITNHRRKVPVPRHTLRLLAGGAKRAVIATVLGHLFRCVYYRNELCRFGGTAKSTWIADVFDVHERNIKAARKHLASIGWLERQESPSWHVNRYGPSVTVKPGWSPVGLVKRQKSPRPSARIDTVLPPPLNRNLPSEVEKTRNLRSRAPGVSVLENKKPRLRNVVDADLNSATRLEQLRQQAISMGLISDTECDRLRFFAAAVHARVIGTINSPGLFAAIVRRKLWHVITQGDEDAACASLRVFDERTYSERTSRGEYSGARVLPKPCHRGDAVMAAERSVIRSIVRQSLGLAESM